MATADDYLNQSSSSLPDRIEKLRRMLQVSQGQYSSYLASAPTAEQTLTDQIKQKLNYNKDVIEMRNRAQSEYFQAPSSAREKYAGIFNPFEREKLVAQERNISGEAYQNAQDIYLERQGRVENIIGASTKAFQAQGEAKRLDYEMSLKAYNDAYQQYQEEQKAQAAQQQQGFENELGLAKFGWQQQEAMLPYQQMTAYQQAELARKQADAATPNVVFNPKEDLVAVNKGGGKQGFLNKTFAPVWNQLQTLAAQKGINLVATDTYRDPTLQGQLYNEMLAGKRKGPVAKPGNSYHNWGAAVDIPAGPGRDFMISIVRQHPELGIKWGGDYDQKKDPPHFYFAGTEQIATVPQGVQPKGPKQPTQGEKQNQAVASLFKEIDTYKRKVDALADVKRHAAQIIGEVGTSGYNAVLKYVQTLPNNWRGKKFRPKKKAAKK